MITTVIGIAEHAIFLALSLLRDVQGMQRTLTQGGLGSPTGRTLFKASVLIYGYGNLVCSFHSQHSQHAYAYIQSVGEVSLIKVL